MEILLLIIAWVTGRSIKALRGLMRLARATPNVMIKVPATQAGIGVIRYAWECGSATCTWKSWPDYRW
jgi:hypothetical protein